MVKNLICYFNWISSPSAVAFLVMGSIVLASGCDSRDSNEMSMTPLNKNDDGQSAQFSDLDVVKTSRMSGSSDVLLASKANKSSKDTNAGGKLVFQDNFEYVVRRDDKKASDIFTRKGGWRWAKTQQDYGSGKGFLYTVDRIPGYAGSFPGRNSTRVLVMEARPATLGNQTDFYLQYGDTDFPADTVPGNVWFQFWIYPNYYDDPADKQDQLSQFGLRNKFIYPCNSGYGCTTGKWIVYISNNSKSPRHQDTANGNLFPYLGSSRVGTISNDNERQAWARSKLGQDNTAINISANRWTLVKIHIDTSTVNGAFEMWLKPMKGEWKKVAEWIDGVTPNFQWRIPANQVGGHRVFRMPTTIPGGARDPLYDFWVYLDDFSMATSEDALPNYTSK